MSSVLCYQEATASDGSRQEWRAVFDPPCLAERSGMLVVELPASEPASRPPRAFVNGLEVIAGVQVVRAGDIVRIVEADGRCVSYVVGRPAPAREPGGGRPCGFTGLPIRGQAINCTCGLLMMEEAVEQLRQCPVCGRDLSPEAGPGELPSEAML